MTGSFAHSRRRSKIAGSREYETSSKARTGSTREIWRTSAPLRLRKTGTFGWTWTWTTSGASTPSSARDDADVRPGRTDTIDDIADIREALRLTRLETG